MITLYLATMVFVSGPSQTVSHDLMTLRECRAYLQRAPQIFGAVYSCRAAATVYLDTAPRNSESLGPVESAS